MTNALTPRARTAAALGAARCVELVVEGKFGVDRLLAVLGAGQELRQPVIALRSEDEIDRGRAADDLLAFGLRDAPGYRDDDAPAIGCGCLFQAAHAAEFGIDLLGRLFANVAGVEDNQVGIVGDGRFDVTLRRERIGHATRVVDVHLAAERFDKQLAGFVHAGRAET